MKIDSIKQELNILILPIIQSVGCELRDLSIKSKKNDTLLQIFISKIDKKPATINDCVIVSKKISYILEEENFLNDNFSLEVSSFPEKKRDDVKIN